MMQQAKTAATVLQKIVTFEESIIAAKIVSDAIGDGFLDDAGEVAEITPDELMIDAEGNIIGVVATVLASAKMVEGVFRSGRFTREVTSPGSNVRALNSLTRGVRRDKRDCKELLSTRVMIPATEPAA